VCGDTEKGLVCGALLYVSVFPRVSSCFVDAVDGWKEAARERWEARGKKEDEEEEEED
jgi:hypothetical protein